MSADTVTVQDALDLVRDGLLNSSRRKMIVLICAAPLIGIATWIVFQGQSILMPAIVAALPLLGLIKIATTMRDLDAHPLVAALREDPLIIKRVRQDVRPIGLIKWRVAASRLVQVELAGDEKYALALRTDDDLATVMALFRMRAERATIDGLTPPDGLEADDEEEEVPRSRTRRKKRHKRG